MSIFNDLYNYSQEYEPVNLYNWQIEFILDDDAYNFMDSRYYVDNSLMLKGEGPERRYRWREQSELLTFMCKKCNLPKKKIAEVYTYCRGMRATFNGGITIDSSLSLSFEESSNRIISRILNNLSNLYTNSDYIYRNMTKTNKINDEDEEIRYSQLNKVSIANRTGNMVGGNVGYNGGYNEYGDGIATGRNNRDLTIKVKMYPNKYGYINPAEFMNGGKPIQEFTFYKCFINNLRYGEGFEYGSEDNMGVECEIMYNWYTVGNVIGNGGDELRMLDETKVLHATNMMEGYTKMMEGYGEYKINNRYKRSI